MIKGKYLFIYCQKPYGSLRQFILDFLVKMKNRIPHKRDPVLKYLFSMNAMDQLKYFTPASKRRIFWSPSILRLMKRPLRSQWTILPNTRPSGEVIPSMDA